MVTPLSLAVFASVLLALALIVARLRGMNLTDALADGSGALIGAALALGVAVVLFSLSAVLPGPGRWPGSLALAASAVAPTLALRRRGRRSTPRALVGALIAVTGVVLWLILNLRGPRGGWTVAELALVLAAAAIAVASGACLGWWSGQARTQAKER